MGMLARFLEFLFPQADTARIVAETSALEFGALLSPSITETGITALLPYRHSRVRAAIIEAKFHRNPKALALLAGTLAEYLASVREESDGFEHVQLCVVPVPLGPSRRRERGYNQVEEVAKCAGAQVATDILRRTRDTPPQTSLTRSARIANMKDAFAVTGSPDASITYTYILLDDVLTTGATLAAAHEALIQGGVSNVLLLSLAH
jgi:ComF family protein